MAVIVNAKETGETTAPPPLRRAVFLDKDGTLVQDVPFNVDPARVVLCEGAVEGLQLLQQHGYELIIVSNQSGIAKGYFDEPALMRLRDHLIGLFAGQGVAIADFYYCPHSVDGIIMRYASLCMCRKPMPGMLLRAAREHGIDRTQSWMVGDILHDVEAGRRAGCKTALIDNGNETEWDWSALRSPDLIASDLFAAAQAITSLDSATPNDSEEAIRQ